tara:strand:+ start:382 stop:1092 length:711 start_codon:yes stop_codon:yes gene_type:complete
MLINPESDIIETSFNEQEKYIKPLEETFKQNLREYIITEDDIKKNLGCAICQESFNLNDKVIKLPCEGTEHFFHKGNTEECDGIFPWFKENNTCPVCRHEFPSEPEPEPEPEPGPEPEPAITNIFESRHVLTPEQNSELGFNGETFTGENMNQINFTDNFINFLETISNNTNNTNDRQPSETDRQPSETDRQPSESQPNGGMNVMSYINNIMREEIIRIREEEELQNAILLSMEER